MLMPGQHAARRGLRGGWRAAAGGLTAVVVALAGAGPAWAADSVYVTITNNADCRFVENAACLGGGRVAMFSVGAGGVLAPKDPATVATGYEPRRIVISPDGRSVYVTTHSLASERPRTWEGTVAMFDVGAGGALSPKSPATVVAGKEPDGIAVSPDGRSVYVANCVRGGGGYVAMFDVGAGGVLSPKEPASIWAGPDPCGIAVSPDGRSVYVTNIWGAGISGPAPGVLSMFDVDRGGVLSPKKPATVWAGPDPFGIAVSQDGRSAYVTNFSGSGGSGPGSVSMLGVGGGGVLSPKRPAAVAPGGNPSAVAVSPDGSSVYVATYTISSSGYGPGSVSMFDVGAGGVLSPKKPAAVAAGTNPNALAVSPDGRSAYVAHANPFGARTGFLSMFDVGAGGMLSPKAPATVAVGPGQQPEAIAVSGQVPPSLPARLTGLGITPAVFAVARQSTPVAAVVRGATIRWTLSRSAKVTIRFAKQTTRSRASRRPVRTLTRRSGPGASRMRFTGRIAGSALTPGTWKLTVTARDSSGSTTTPQTRLFRIVKG